MRLFPDVDEETECRMIEEIRNMTPAQKLQQMFNLIDAGREKIKTEIRQQYPNDSEEKIKMRFAREVLGRDLAIKAYGYNSDIDG